MDSNNGNRNSCPQGRRRNDLTHQYKLGASQLENNFAGKDLGGSGVKEADHEPVVLSHSQQRQGLD